MDLCVCALPVQWLSLQAALPVIILLTSRCEQLGCCEALEAGHAQRRLSSECTDTNMQLTHCGLKAFYLFCCSSLAKMQSCCNLHLCADAQSAPTGVTGCTAQQAYLAL